MKTRTTKARLAKLGVAVACATGFAFTGSPSAQATAQTCVTAPLGYVCTTVNGSGTWVSSIDSIRGKVEGQICNSSAWFFYIPPGGGAYGLGYQVRKDCVWTRAWFRQPVNRHFPRGTLVCAKFMENGGAFVGERCVGIS